MPVSSVGQPAYRQSRLSHNRKHARQTDSMAGMSEDMSCEEQNTDQTDAYSVTSETKFETLNLCLMTNQTWTRGKGSNK